MSGHYAMHFADTSADVPCLDLLERIIRLAYPTTEVMNVIDMVLQTSRKFAL